MSSRSNRALLAMPVLLLAPVLFGARGCGEPVPVGGCDESACGAALGAPAIACWDGSVGGNTGRCVAAADGTCGWEIRDCPPPPDDCTDVDCGPAPLTPFPTHCERGQDDLCHWVIDDPGECGSDECGPAPGASSWICPDGTVGGFTGRCVRAPDSGACGWERVDCPMTGECTIDECGPAPGAPACTCVDGSSGCSTGRCLRDASGVCGWEWRDCPTEEIVCGGFTPMPVDCGPGSLCAYPVDAICGAADATGVCRPRPQAESCAALDSAPVCGCDGVTYENECFAWAAGTSATSHGPCAGADCDIRDVPCDSLPPTCPAGQVPTQSAPGGCWGPCVPVASCAPMACASEVDCPDSSVWACVSGVCTAR